MDVKNNIIYLKLTLFQENNFNLLQIKIFFIFSFWFFGEVLSFYLTRNLTLVSWQWLVVISYAKYKNIYFIFIEHVGKILKIWFTTCKFDCSSPGISLKMFIFFLQFVLTRIWLLLFPSMFGWAVYVYLFKLSSFI